MSYFIRNIISLLFFGISFLAKSQNTLLENINAKQGLPSNNVYLIQKDKFGFIWFSTNMGITRYDGYQFVSVGPKNKADGMDVSEDGFLWFSNNKGLFKADLGTFKVQNIVKSNLLDANADNDHFDGIFLDKSGLVWSTDFHHIKVYNPKKKHLRYFKILEVNQQSPNLAKFTIDKKGDLWCVCPIGLMRFDYKLFTWIVYYKSNDLVTLHYNNITNQILLGTHSGDLLSFNANNRTTKHLESFYQSILDIKTTNRKVIVLLKEAVSELKGNKKKSFSENLGEKIIFHNCFVDTAKDEVWISSDEGVFHQASENQLIFSLKFPESFKANQSKVLCFEKLENKKYALGLDDGRLVNWDQSQNKFTIVNLPNVGQVRKILKINNDLYLACQKGIFLINNRLRRLFEGEFTDICLDEQERIWMIRPNLPFLVFDIKSKKVVIPWKKLPNSSFFTENRFNKMHASSGKLWFAAWFPKGFGAVYFDPKAELFFELSDFNDHKKFVSDYYLNLAPGNNSNMLFAAYGGFNVFNKNGIIIDKHNSEDFQNTIGDYQYFNIAQQKDGSIWVGNKEGLVRISKKVNRFTQFDGLLSNDISNGFFLDDSLLLLGMKNGVSIVDFKVFKPESHPINNLILSRVFLLGQQYMVKTTENLIFSKKNNSIGFSFSPLNFEAAPKNKFRYKLNGISELWIENGSNPNIVFSNLEKGKYNLEVQYAKVSRDWSDQTTNVYFEILPAWYETIWFRLILATFLLSLFYIFYRFRLNEIKKVYDIRNRISADLHDEIGASLSSIGIMGGLLIQNLLADKKNKGFAEMIAEEANKAGNAIDYIIWNINPKFDSLESLFAKINKEAAELIEAQNLQYEFESNDLLNKNLSLENKRNLYLVLKELINNALKYSKAQKISLHCFVKSKQLNIKFADDGCGFDIHQPTNRNGIVNIKSRIKTMKGNYKIASQIGKGTTFEIKIPLK